VVRYMAHSILHLCGYDDLKPAERRRMKQVENRLVTKLSRHFKLAALGR
jgi:ssRNA-specific RNase YbeY (16S rRNA maturation enzyme)